MERLNTLVTRAAALLLLAGSLLPLRGFAGPVEDARALLAAGKPGEVDKALGNLLDRRPVPNDVLAVSLEAALADGRPYTAERRVTELLEKGGEISPKLIYQGALVAGQLGKASLRRERLLFFLRQEKGWNADVEAALLVIILDGGDADYAVRYFTSAPATEANLDLGLRLMEQLRGARRMQEYVRVLETLITRFEGVGERTRLLADAATIINEGIAGLQTAVFEALARFPLHEHPVFMDMITRRNEFGAALTIDYCARNKLLLPAAVFGRVRNLEGVKEPEKRKALGAQLESLEPLCLASNRADHLRALIETVIRVPDVFLESKPPRYDSARLAKLFSTLVVNDWKRLDQLRVLGSEIISRKVLTEEHAAKLMQTYPNAFEARALVWPKMAEQARATKDLGPTRELFKATGNRPDIRWMALGYISELGDGGLVKEIVAEHVLTRPLDFDSDNVARHLLGCEAMGANDRVNALKALFARTGYTPAWKKLIGWGQNPLKDDAAFKAFAATVVEGAKGNDPLIAECAAMNALQRGADNSAPAEAHAIAARALKLYTGAYPDPRRPQASEVFGALWRKYHELTMNSRDDATQFLRQMTPRAGEAADWTQLFNLARATQNTTNYLQVCAAFVKLFPDRADELTATTYPFNSTVSMLAPHYGTMLPDNAAAHVAVNCERWTPAVRVRELAALHKAVDFRRLSAPSLARLLTAWQILAPTNAFQAQIPFDALAATLIDQRAGTASTRLHLLALHARAGKSEATLGRWLEATRKLDPVSRVNELMALLNADLPGCGALVAAEAEGASPTKLQFGALLRDELLPALKAVPPQRSLSLAPVQGGRFLEIRAALAGRQKQDKDVLGAAQACGRELALRLSDGLPWPTEPWRIHPMVGEAFMAALAVPARAEMARLARLLGATHTGDGGALLQSLEAAKTAEIWEPLHVVASSVTGAGGAFAAGLTRMRAEAATHMPGIYPVPENHPTYPLFVAADELERNNPERAWALLRNALVPFEREALKLPPDFVIWGVEQLRRARGPKDAMLLKARAIADQLLTRESSLTPELAASMLLARAECFRDQRNFEAARLEYQTLRNNTAYRKTLAARRAMFRDVDLLIEIGNATAAEAIIEYWLSQPDVEVQAQAHYFLARISFARKDYSETRKHLDNVFTLDFTHTEARLLHGAWKLATNYEVDDTAVLVGDLSDRTIIRPGQQLTITVQDRNLGVAGGGGSIPLVVKTSKGGDIENVALYPSTRDPHLFRGTIDTRLGLAVPTNRVVDLRGEEQVSYEVEPTFLKLRGLETTPPKLLRVVDDARLAIGAGAPDAEAAAAEEELERLLTDDASRGGGNLGYSLRPGNPLYVVVRDRDRSSTPEADKLHVEARTSSGDRLDRVELAETGPFSGIFRGVIRTTLPPPRASASDTATGFNAGDTINSTRNGVWRSVPDSEQGKWIEVDTMGSHSISNIAMMMPDPSVVRAVRLTGRLVDETLILGSLPAEDLAKRYGLRAQAAEGRKINEEAGIRAFFAGAKAPAPKAITNLVFTPVHRNRDMAQNALLSGAFVLPEALKGKLRLRIVALDTKGRTFAGLWMAMAIDGVTVFTGQGNSLHRRVVTLEIPAGAHRIEVFASASYPEDGFEILHEPIGGRPGPFPLAWCDPAQGPELVEFLSDRARITRDDKGFTAMIAKPERLRSVRWEFLDYTGRDLSVQKIYIQDVAGKLIIPVKSDFSDALQNDTLEVAPGDRITVAYLDETTSSGEKRTHSRSMGSSFNDAKVSFNFEEVSNTRQGRRTELFEAYRFLPGDTLVVKVTDMDADQTPEADRVKVKIKTFKGREMVIDLVEQSKVQSDGVHGGEFLGLVRTAAAGAVEPPPGTLPVEPVDMITASYFDRENTRPGVPVERTAEVPSAQPSEPELTLFHTRVELTEDTSQDAKLRLAQIRRRPGNEHVVKLYREQVLATEMTAAEMAEIGTNAVPMNLAAPIPLKVLDPSRARHSGSVVMIEAMAQSEIDAAALEGFDPEPVRLALDLSEGKIGFFEGSLTLRLGPPDPAAMIVEGGPRELSVNGNDTIRLRVLGPRGETKIERRLRLVTAGTIALMDSTYSAERLAAHVGERFFVQVTDADRDTGAEIDEVEVEVTALTQGHKRRLRLKETLPHSGIFSGTLRPVIFGPGEAVPSAATGGVARAGEELDDRLSVKYGEQVRFSYFEAATLPGLVPGMLVATGSVYKGSDGNVRVFSKRFRDSDMAVLVQFRLAECLFERAKEHRRLKQPDRSAAAIEEGKFILEEALRNYPDTSHVVEGEYLLANLYQELAMEQKEAKNKDAAAPLFTEALSRFSAILSTWPEGKFAARAQYHKALCLEMLGDYSRASEEYVKMTYLFPDSELVGDASIRLATYYYAQEKRYDIAGRIYSSFQRRFPTHEKADRALFMSAQCHMKQAEQIVEDFRKSTDKNKRLPEARVNDEYLAAVEALETLTDKYRETAAPGLRAQALYWAGDASLRAKVYDRAYLYLKRTVFEYPETEWARRARGLLLQEAKAFEELE